MSRANRERDCDSIQNDRALESSAPEKRRGAPINPARSHSAAILAARSHESVGQGRSALPDEFYCGLNRDDRRPVAAGAAAAVGEQDDTRFISHDLAPSIRCGDRDVRQLFGRGIRDYGTIGEG